MINDPKPNKEAFDLVCDDIDRGVELNLHMLGLIFGPAFWKLLVLCHLNIDIKDINNVTINIIEKQDD